MPSKRTIAAFCAGVAATVAVALAIQSATAGPRSYSPYRKLNVFAKVLTYVENNYVESVDDSKLIYGAISGMMEALDPHSTFLTPEQYQQMKADTQGEFGGLGMEVEVRDSWLTVVSPLEGTPAARAGIRPGDQIRKINGKSTEQLALHEAVRIMRGPRGTRVSITLQRPGQKKPLELTLVRDIIKVISVSAKLLEPGFGLIRLKNFQEGTNEQVRAAIGQMQEQRKLRGLILDLRNNPGGLFDQAAKVADLFLQSGLIVRTKGKGGEVMDEERAHAKDTITELPLICLVNGGSASASEIVAGALQDHKRAVVLGLRTFGKGSVQTIIDLEDGSGLKLTVARYYTPAGRSIQEQGIIPDILVEETAPKTVKRKAQREEDLAHHLPGEKRKAPSSKPLDLQDFQLSTALSYLKAAEIFRQQTNRSGPEQPACQHADSFFSGPPIHDMLRWCSASSASPAPSSC